MAYSQQGAFVTFDVQNTVRQPYRVEARCGVVERPADPCRPGYHFCGWYRDAACTIPWNFERDRAWSTTTLFASWLKAYRGCPQRCSTATPIVTTNVRKTATFVANGAQHNAASARMANAIAARTENEIGARTVSDTNAAAEDGTNAAATNGTNARTAGAMGASMASGVSARMAKASSSKAEAQGIGIRRDNQAAVTCGASTRNSNQVNMSGKVLRQRDGINQKPVTNQKAGAPQMSGANPRAGMPQTLGANPRTGLPQAPDAANPRTGIPQTPDANPRTGLPQAPSEKPTSTLNHVDKMAVGSRNATVTFERNGGRHIPPQLVVRRNLAIRPADPTHDRLDFAGWYKDAELTRAWDFCEDRVEGDITLYAKYR